MKQYALLFVLLFFGVGGSLFWTPATGVGIYYLLAVLRPQFIWKFQLSTYPELKGMAWSFYVAAAAIGSYLLWSIGLLSYGRSENSVMRYSPAFTWAHRIMMMFAVWISLSFVFSMDQNRSEDWYGEYLKIFIMYFVAARVIRTPNQVWMLYMLITVALGYIGFDGNMLYLQTGVVTFYKRGYAQLDNNGAGLMLALGVPLCFFAWEMTRGWYRWLFLFCSVSLVHAVLTTYSRGAMGSMALTAPFYFLYTKKRWQVAIIAVLMTPAVGYMAGKEIVERFTSIEKRDVDASYQSRELSWRIATEIANDYPIFGAGIRCSAIEMKKRGADMEGRTIHSQYLQVAADSGWIAFVLYILVVVTTFLSIWKARRRLWRRDDPDSKRAVAMLGGIECALITFVIGANFLSLEVFEPAYLLLLIGVQVWALLNSTDTGRPEIGNQSQFRYQPRVQPKPALPQKPPPRLGPPTGKHPMSRFQQPSPPPRSGP